MKVAAIQHDIVWEDPPANFERLAPQIAAAAGAGAQLVVLTEMYSTGFSLQSDRIAEGDDGPSTSFLVSMARTHRAWMCGSIPRRPSDGGLPRNTLVLAGPDGELHRYDKIHPFSYAGEHERYAAGDRLVVVDIGGVRTALFVCYDLRFADEFWGLAPKVDLYVVVANWPASRRHHWRTLLVARAIENQAYVIGVNRVGTGGGLDYVGDSRIVDPLGEIVASAAATEALLITEISPEHVAEVRARFPFLADRR